MVNNTIMYCGSTDEGYLSWSVGSGRLHGEKDDGSQSPAYMKVRTRRWKEVGSVLEPGPDRGWRSMCDTHHLSLGDKNHMRYNITGVWARRTKVATVLQLQIGWERDRNRDRDIKKNLPLKRISIRGITWSSMYFM